MTINTTKNDIVKRLSEIDFTIYSLECSDDSLFSNSNGNLIYYRSLEEERDTLRRRLTIWENNVSKSKRKKG